MEKRVANIIFSKNGNGFQTTKITLPVGWVKELGADPNNKEVIIILNDKKIEIMKREDFNMKKIISNGELADLILERYQPQKITRERLLDALDAERTIEEEENVEIDVEKEVESWKTWIECNEEE
jgi:hypothetical protein